ncbi:PIR protein [Plasmodium vivax]|uniref:VIR protein n=1 Tax=Plasmodium vivax TaxID=5855 RepID=A0A565A5A2_PLAVI|nr:PIR protein [Plasmodium vivax]
METLGLFNKLDSEIIKIPEIIFATSLNVDTSDYEDINQYIRVCHNCRNPFIETKAFIRKLAKNYDNYKKHSKNDSNNCIPCVWKNLEENNNTRKGKCDFDNVKISHSFIEVMKLLHEMCLIRGNVEVIKTIISDREKCIQFNEKIKTDLKNMLLYISTISGEPELKKSYFDIYNGCALKDVKTLFKEIECKPEVKETCPEPKTCDTAPPSTKQNCKKDSCSNLQELCNEYYPSKECECEEKVIQPDCQNPTPDILKQFCPNFCAANPQDALPAIKDQQGNPNKNPLLQVPVTVLSSVVGTIFFFLLLYKFTPFRTWFLNRIGSKKTLNHKMRQDMDREYLGVPFQPPYRDDQNSRPRVGYSQNKR